MLYLVPTPIGNMADITLRAIDLLRSVDVILAEDTRVTGKLLRHHAIETPMQSYHAHNEHARTTTIVEQLAAGATLALVSDAGTPGLSDPGFLLVRACREAGIAVGVLPGASALLPALVGSGLPCDKFHFEGFLPHKKGRQTRLKYLAVLPVTFVLYESPHRLVRCLKELMAHCGPDRMASVARELTKLHEEQRTDTLAALYDYFSDQPKIRGEIVLVVSS